MKGNFERKKIRAGEWMIDLEIAGNGPPLLLLHGFPETKFAWNKITSRLADSFTLILPDIPGYGDSVGPFPDEDHHNYSKRATANVMMQVMHEAGFKEFAVAGHDRGGRIAYRMALDHPKEITRLAVLNIIPTLEVVEGITYEKAYNMENWFFLSQPSPFPETLINSNPEFYLNHILDSWSLTPGLISKESRAEYLQFFKDPKVIFRICAEYRASKIDAAFDKEDRDNNCRITCPLLALWSVNDFPDNSQSPLVIWKSWADNVSGSGLSCGHFLMEERPDDVLYQLLKFFGNSLVDGYEAGDFLQ